MANGVAQFRDPNARQLLHICDKARALAASLKATVQGSKRTKLAMGMLQELSTLLEQDAKYRERNIIL